MDETTGLVGYWPFRGDCRDHSGANRHGINHGVDLATGSFASPGRCIEIPGRPDFQFGAGEFTLSAWIHTEQRLDTAVGDVLTRYDPVRRRGFTLSIQASSGGYCGQGDDRHVAFGIDNDRDVVWEECGIWVRDGSTWPSLVKEAVSSCTSTAGWRASPLRSLPATTTSPPMRRFGSAPASWTG